MSNNENIDEKMIKHELLIAYKNNDIDKFDKILKDNENFSPFNIVVNNKSLIGSLNLHNKEINQKFFNAIYQNQCMNFIMDIENGVNDSKLVSNLLKNLSEYFEKGDIDKKTINFLEEKTNFTSFHNAYYLMLKNKNCINEFDYITKIAVKNGILNSSDEVDKYLKLAINLIENNNIKDKKIIDSIFKNLEDKISINNLECFINKENDLLSNYGLKMFFEKLDLKLEDKVEIIRNDENELVPIITLMIYLDLNEENLKVIKDMDKFSEVFITKYNDEYDLIPLIDLLYTNLSDINVKSDIIDYLLKKDFNQIDLDNLINFYLINYQLNDDNNFFLNRIISNNYGYIDYNYNFDLNGLVNYLKDSNDSGFIENNIEKFSFLNKELLHDVFVELSKDDKNINLITNLLVSNIHNNKDIDISKIISSDNVNIIEDSIVRFVNVNNQNIANNIHYISEEIKEYNMNVHITKKENNNKSKP